MPFAEPRIFEEFGHPLPSHTPLNGSERCAGKVKACVHVASALPRLDTSLIQVRPLKLENFSEFEQPVPCLGEVVETPAALRSGRNIQGREQIVLVTP